MINFKEIGARIKKLRLKNDLTQEKFAELLGISVEHLSRIETGAFRPSLTLIEKICSELNTTEEIIMFGVETETSEVKKIAKKLDNLDKDKLKAIDLIIDLIS